MVMWWLKWFITGTMTHIVICQSNLKVIKQWNALDFVFPSEDAKLEAETKGYHTLGNSVPLDIDVHYLKDGNKRIFMTTPRFGLGRPATLSIVDPKSNLLMPYPDYSWHDNQGKNCDGITSALRIYIDECSRLWVMDNGRVNEIKYCEPQILAFDLNTNELIYRHRFDPIIVNRQRTFFVNIIADVLDPHDGCQNTFLYVSDVDSFAIMVHDVLNNATWRVDNKLFFPYPSEGTFNIAGETFELMDGVLAMALSPRKENESDRTLYFHSLASFTENTVKTSVLQNGTLYANGTMADPKLFKLMKHKRSSQTGAIRISEKGIMFFGHASYTDLACWNTATEYRQSNIDILAEDPVRLQFASSVKIQKNLAGEEELWVMTNRFQKSMTGTMSLNETNYRIMTGKVAALLEDSFCTDDFDHTDLIVEY